MGYLGGGALELGEWACAGGGHPRRRADSRAGAIW